MKTSTVDHLKSIFLRAVQRVDPGSMIKDLLKVEGNRLSVSWGEGELVRDLSGYDRVCVLGAGKATARMALAVEELLGERITEGLIAVKYGHTENLSILRTIEAGHPVPDENSRKAAEEMKNMADGCDDRTLTLVLISGGGSALLSLPVTDDISLADKQETTRLLLACGAMIQEINCVRKHLSGIKGGRLAEQLYPSDSITLILSDVVGDRLDTIASGPTVPDTTTYQDVSAIFSKYGLTERLPSRVLSLIKAGTENRVPETPSSDSAAFSKVKNIVIGSNIQALQAAAAKARELKYNTVILSSQLTGEAREAARFFYGIGKDILEKELLVQKPACVIAGGETTVTLLGEGMGGRNQEMACAFCGAAAEEGAYPKGISFLSGATDGNDGPTDAAGGYITADIFETAIRRGLNPDTFIKASDSYRFLSECGGLLVTGPTNTNVCDIQLLLVE